MACPCLPFRGKAQAFLTAHQPLAKALARVREPGPDCAFGNVQHPGDLFVRAALDLFHYKDFAVLLVKVVQRMEQDFAQFAPPAVAARAARVIARAAVAEWMDVPFNVVISNVPGPQFPLFGIGSKLVANYPVSAINDGIGLNMTVQSYNGSLDFGFIACRELMPDLWDLMDYLRDELRELKEAAKEFGRD